MSLECSECEHDLRGGHAPTCSRRLPVTLCAHGSLAPKCVDCELAQALAVIERVRNLATERIEDDSYDADCVLCWSAVLRTLDEETT
jgi:hypothetical protein